MIDWSAIHIKSSTWSYEIGLDPQMRPSKEEYLRGLQKASCRKWQWTEAWNTDNMPVARDVRKEISSKIFQYVTRHWVFKKEKPVQSGKYTGYYRGLVFKHTGVKVDWERMPDLPYYDRNIFKYLFMLWSGNTKK